MDELTILREAWERPEPPSAQVRFQARAALTRRGRRRLPRVPRMTLRLAAVGALAAVTAAGITVVQNTGGTDGKGHPKPIIPGIPAGPVANAAQALDRAATAAEAKPFTPPRPGQWVCVVNRLTTSAHAGGVSTGGPYVTHRRPMWRSADGKKSARLMHGKVQVQVEPGPLSPPADYPTLAAMPTQPDKVLAWVWQQMGGLADGTKAQRYALAYDTLNTILRDSLLPPKVEAAIFRAMKTIPGVTLAGKPVNVTGHPALVLGMVEEGWLHEEVLLDKRTYAYLGERSIAVKSHSSHGDDGTVRVKKGVLQEITVRVKAGVVDKPGDLP